MSQWRGRVPTNEKWRDSRVRPISLGIVPMPRFAQPRQDQINELLLRECPHRAFVLSWLVEKTEVMGYGHRTR